MSFKRISASMEMNIADGLAKWVLVTLAHHEHSRSGHCYPSIDRLVKVTGLSRSTVMRCLKKLVDLQLIRKHPDRGKSTHYEFLFEYKVVRLDSKGCLTDTTPVSDRHPNREVIKKDVGSGNQVVELLATWFPTAEQQRLLNIEFGEIDHAKEIIKYRNKYKNATIVNFYSHYKVWCSYINQFERARENNSHNKLNKPKSFGSGQKASLTNSVRSILQG